MKPNKSLIVLSSLVITIIALFTTVTAPTMAAAPGIPLRDTAPELGRAVGTAMPYFKYRNDPTLASIVPEEFNMLTAEYTWKMKWFQPSQGRYDWQYGDEYMDFTRANGMQMRGHVLVWHRGLPGWIESPSRPWTRETLLAVMEDHIKTVVGRYRGQVPYWDVVNEAIVGNGSYRNTVWYDVIGPDYIEYAFRWAHEADPDALLYYNDFSADEMNAKSDGIYNMISNLIARGVPIHGMGFQAHTNVGRGFNADSARQNVQRFVDLGLEVQYTEADVRLAGATGSYGNQLEQQAAVFRDMASVCANEPACTAFIVWGVSDKYSALNDIYGAGQDPLLFDNNWQAKPAYFAVRDALAAGVAVNSPVGDTPPPPPAPLVNAVDDNFSMNQDSTLQRSAPGLLNNDSSESGGMTIISSSSPAHGTLSVNSDGGFTYTPTVGYSGYDSFTYVVSNGSSQDEALVSITVNHVDDDACTPLYRINAGGPAIPASDGGPEWAADTTSNPSPYVNATSASNNTGTASATVDTAHPSLPANVPATLFQNERYNNNSAIPLRYSFPVAPGMYTVRVYMAELFFNEAGRRVYDVFVEGSLRLNDYDVYAQVGRNVGVMRNFDLPSDGTLDVEFVNQTENASVVGLEIIAHDCSSEPPTDPTPPPDDPEPTPDPTPGSPDADLVTEVRVSKLIPQQIEFQIIVRNNSDAPVTNLSYRLYYTPDNARTAEAYDLFTYWVPVDGVTTSGPVTEGDGQAYHTIDFGSNTLAAGDDWRFSGAIQTNDWRPDLDISNDWWLTEYGDSFVTTDYIPVYLNGVQVAGLAPTSSPSVPTNNPPTAVDDTGTTTEGSPLLLEPLANDSDPDGDVLTLVSAATPGNGTVMQNSNALLYTPADGFVGTDSFTYTVTDGELTSSATITVTVDAPNFPPTLDAIPDQVSTVGEAVSVQATGSDPDGGALVYMADGLPDGVTIDAVSGLMSGTPTTEGSTTVTVRVVADDSDEASISFLWTVNAAPDLLPTLNAIPDQFSTVGDAVSVQAVGNDPDGGALVYNATGLPAGVTIDAVSGLMSGTPTTASTTTVTVTVTATDADEASVSFTWTVNAEPVDLLPTLNAIPDQVSTVGDAVSVQAVGNDPDGGALIYNATGLPAGVTIDAVSGLMSGAPTTASTTTVTVTVIATDADEASVSFAWTVNAVETTPDPEPTPDPTPDPEPTEPPSAPESDLGVQLRVSNMSNKYVEFQIDVVNEGDEDQDDLSYRLYYTPDNGRAGTDYAIRRYWAPSAEITAFGPEEAEDDQWYFTISLGNMTLEAGESARFSGAINVVDWRQDLDAANDWWLTEYGEEFGPTDYIPVYDDEELVAGLQPGMPADDAGAPVAVDDSVTTQAGVAAMIAPLANDSDPDGDTLTLESFTEPSDGELVQNGNALLYTPNEGFTGADSFSYTVSDGELSDSATVTISVQAALNLPPSLDPIPDQNSVVGDAVTIQVVGSDPDGSALRFAASGLPNGVTIDASGGLIAGSPTTAGVYSVQVRAVAGDGDEALQSFSWTVTAGSGDPAPDDPRPIVEPIPDQVSTVGQAVSVQVRASDPQGDRLYYFGNFPPGVSIDRNTGLISGTPTEVGVFNASVMARDANVNDRVVTFTWTVNAPEPVDQRPIVEPIPDQVSTVGQAVSVQVRASDPQGDRLYYFGNFPPGVSIDRNTGRVSGTPTTAGVFNASVMARDAAANDRVVTFTWTVNAAAAPPPLAGGSATLSVEIQTQTISTQQAQFNYRLTNDGSDPVSNLSVRLYFRPDNGRAASDYVLERYWDQSRAATINGPISAGGDLYYFEISYGSATLAPGRSWQYNGSMHLNNWRNDFDASNDWWLGVRSANGFVPTDRLPVYSSGTLVAGAPV